MQWNMNNSTYIPFLMPTSLCGFLVIRLLERIYLVISMFSESRADFKAEGLKSKFEWRKANTGVSSDVFRILFCLTLTRFFHLFQKSTWITFL